MKTIFAVLIVLLVLTIGIGNERPVKLTEAKSCQEAYYSGSCARYCDGDCKSQFGSGASGQCDNARSV
ncbi:hypothetical protein RIF29_40417 [Crotalaria pallida]|uniref:Uncharacterized protein n=1 Tax=Crotalaria pallida TaxID=3830 RepID=A0AAN9E3M9_CROPI